MKRRIGVGFVGAGRINWNHVANLSRQQNVELVGVADIAEEKAREMAKAYGMNYTKDYRTLLKDPKIDAVWIATPPNIRGLVIEFLEAGKHVMLEKPMSLSLKEAAEMTRATKKAGVKFQIGFMKRHAPRFTKVKQIIEKGELGNPIWCLAYYNGIPEIWYGPEWCWNVNVSGGLTVENTAHYLDTVRWLVGSKVVKVYSNLAKLYRREKNIEDSGAIILHFEKPVISMVSCGMNAPETFPHENIMLICTDGGLEAEASLTFIPGGFVENSELIIHDRESRCIRSWRYSSAGYEEEDAYFIKCIRENLKPIPDGEDARTTLEICLASLLSVKRGEPITLPLKEPISVQDLLPLPWTE